MLTIWLLNVKSISIFDLYLTAELKLRSRWGCCGTASTTALFLHCACLEHGKTMRKRVIDISYPWGMLQRLLHTYFRIQARFPTDCIILKFWSSDIPQVSGSRWSCLRSKGNHLVSISDIINVKKHFAAYKNGIILSHCYLFDKKRKQHQPHFIGGEKSCKHQRCDRISQTVQLFPVYRFKITICCG